MRIRSRPPTTATRPPDVHVVVHDEGCGFCRWCADVIVRRARRPVRSVGFTELPVGDWLTGLAADQIRASVHLIAPDGREYHGGHAVTQAARLLRGGRPAAVFDLPGLAWFRDAGYAVVASQRGRLSRVVRH